MGFMMKKVSALVLCFLFACQIGYGQEDSGEESLDQKIIDATQREYLNLDVLLQGVGLYSFDDTDFNGGRTFENGLARLGIKGNVDKKFDYRIQLDFTNDPVLLDVYFGYSFNDKLKVRAGSQKPLASADQIQSRGDTDFINRARLVGTVYKRREVGLVLYGDIGNFHYYSGLFNGNGVDVNEDNNFLLRNRIEYTFQLNQSRLLTLGFNSAYTESTGETLSNSDSIIMNGERYSLGGDIQFDNGSWFTSAEFLYTEFEALGFTGRADITASYITFGYRPEDDWEVLVRWDRVDFDDSEALPDNTLYTIGVNRQISQLMSFQFNLLAQFDDDIIDEQAGIAFNLQFEL